MKSFLEWLFGVTVLVVLVACYSEGGWKFGLVTTMLVFMCYQLSEITDCLRHLQQQQKSTANDDEVCL
jgi:hypothetical protein